jgi:hypothetical protein
MTIPLPDGLVFQMVTVLPGHVTQRLLKTLIILVKTANLETVRTGLGFRMLDLYPKAKWSSFRLAKTR